MQRLLTSVVVYWFAVAQVSTTTQTPPHPPRRYITRCTYDSQNFSLLDAHALNKLEPLDDVTIRARRSHTSEQGASFTFSRKGKQIGKIDLDDLFNPNGWITPSPTWKRFAITWSDGGGGGDWHTRIFHFSATGRLSEDAKGITAVENDFRPRHHCAERGDNFTAIRWMDDDHLLVEASVYNSSACDSEMGYTEGFVLNASSDSIQQHFSELQMLDLPEVCTVNSYAEDDSLPR
jgi:hypothetical protein